MIKHSAAINPDLLKVVTMVLRNSGQVKNIEYVKSLLDRNPILYIEQTKDYGIAIAALKHPFYLYKKKIFNLAKTSEKPGNYFYELGWVYCSDESRGNGYAKAACKKLSSMHDRMYSTVKASNNAMINILISCGFIHAGEPYTTDEGETFLLFIKNASYN